MALTVALRSAGWSLAILATLALPTFGTQQSPAHAESKARTNPEKGRASSDDADEGEQKPPESDNERTEPKESVDPRPQLRMLKQIAQGGDIKSGALKPSLGGGMLGLLLSSPALQRELNLTGDQASGVAGLSAQMIESRQDIKKEMKERKKLMRDSGVEYNKAPKIDAYATLHQENEAALGRILKPRQKERLEQIRLRIIGPSALADPKVASKVGLTAEQHSQIVLIVEQAQAADADLLKNAQDPMAKESVAKPAKPGAAKPGAKPDEDNPIRRKIKALEDARERSAKNADDQIAKILLARQRKAFNNLLGQPIDLATLLEPTPATKKEAASQEDSTPGKTKRKKR